MAVNKKHTRKKAGKTEHINLTVNGHAFTLEVGTAPHQTDPADTLAYTLRETLGLTGTKVSCDHGACGSCTVLMDGKAVLSCMTLTVECDGKNITTVEGLCDPETGEFSDYRGLPGVEERWKLIVPDYQSDSGGKGLV